MEPLIPQYQHEDRDQSNNSQISTMEQLHQKPRQQKTLLYVKVHDIINDIHTLGKVLTAKVNTKGVQFTPAESDIIRSESCTFCTLTLPSKSLAKTLRNLLLKERERFKPLIECSFTDFDKEKEQQKHVEKCQQLQKQVLSEFDLMSNQLLKDHSVRCESIEKKIADAKQNLNDLNTLNQTLEEIKALENKLQELELHKTEFMQTVHNLKYEVVGVMQKDNFQSDLRDLQRQFGIECCRLQNPLPMYARRRDIVDLVKKNQVSVVLGETGSGKSTQMVQYLLEAGLAENGTIVCTQPRKVAAMSLAIHVANELATNVGNIVGYKMGSRNKSSQSTKIVFMTDHTLLNECLVDPNLKAFSCIVIDEAHERSLHTDLLLGMIKRCLRQRPELRVVITSATIDPQVFVDFFHDCNDCPVMRVSGRTFPVEIIWQDTETEEDDFDDYVNEAVKTAVEIHLNEPSGDILVFLTTPLEIITCCELFQQKLPDKTDFKCLQLHGQLQPAEQQKVFEPLGRNTRKIVFATNCAETSITIDGIKYVVDTGLAKEMRYDAKRNINSLNVTVISKSSAEQRKGRAGRTAPGKCYRLYSERSFNSMDSISQPEILRTHLGSALLKLAELGIGPDMYDFVQSPSKEAIGAALETLDLLGAMKDGKITETGRWMAKLPFDPKFGLMTILGKDNDILYDSIALAAVMSAGSGVFYRGTAEENQKKFDKAKTLFSHEGGDGLSALAVYKAWQAMPENEKNKWCVENSMNAKVLRSVRETVNEILFIFKKEFRQEVVQTFSEAKEETDKQLQKMIFQCQMTNLCHFLGLEKAGYFAARVNRQVHLHPSSCLNSLAKVPEWVVYDQLLKTSRDFITGITPVEESWLSEVRAHNLGFSIEDTCNKKVTKVYAREAGTHVFFSLVGVHYSRLKMYEEIVSSDPLTVVVFEANREAGELRVYSTKPVDKTLKILLEETAKAAVQEIWHKDFEQPLGQEEMGVNNVSGQVKVRGVRVVLGQGGQVVEILMPDQTRKIFISSPAPDTTEEMIRSKFKHFGTITQCIKFKGGKNWGFVTFQTKLQATAAAEGTKNDEYNIGQLEHRPAVKSNADFKARLTWCRRVCRGFGNVEVYPMYLAACLRLGTFYVGNSLVTVMADKKNKDKDSLYLRNLPPDVTEDLIKYSLLCALSLRENEVNVVKNISVARFPVEQPTKKELDELQAKIKKQIEAHLRSSKVEVIVRKPPTPKSALFMADAFFTDPMEGIAVCNTLKNSLLVDNHRVTVEPFISARIAVRKRIMEFCQARADAVIAELKLREVKITSEQSPNGNYTLHIQASDVQNVVLARTLLGSVFKGDVWDCSANSNFMHLVTSAGRRFLQEVERDTNTYILVDSRQNIISIFGSESACTQVGMKMNDYLDAVLNGTSEEILLKGVHKPPGLMKALITKYGEDLDQLRVAAGLHSLNLDYYRHKLTLVGPSDSIHKASDMISQMEEEVWAASKRPKPDVESVDCVACFCPIESGELHRLEICAHPYCQSCLKHQVNVAITSRTVPVLCCQEGCGQALAWYDISYLARKGMIRLSDLAEASISFYVLANRDKARFCVTPNCPMVYCVSREEQAEVFLCPECGVQICTACHKQAHAGMTCAMVRIGRNERQDVQMWVNQDPTCRKACPHCNAPIEKIGGCNRMICEACRTVFCWLCAQTFATEGSCYAHLQNNH